MCQYPQCINDWTVSVGQHQLKLCDVHKDKTRFSRGQCDKCGRTVEVGGKTVVDSTYLKTSQVLLCEDPCSTLERRTCGGCERVVQVGGSDVVDGLGSYVDGIVLVCKQCTVAEKCRPCGAPAAVKDENQQPVPMIGARRIRTVQSNQTVGWRCAACAANSITSKSDAEKFYREAVRWMTAWVKSCKREYPNYGKRLEWELALDAEFEAKHGRLTPGSCKTTGDKEKKHKIQVLNYITQLAFQVTLLHELTHALTSEFGCGDKRLIEGFCEYVPYLYLLEQETKGSTEHRAEATRRLDRMEKNTSKEYGDYFRTVRDELKPKPARALEWFAKSN